MQQSVSSNCVPMDTAGVHWDTRTAPSASYTVSSTTTLMGHRSHTVTTRDSRLAYALYEQALQIDIEPDFDNSKGMWSIGFICTDSERDNAVSAASGVTA